MTTQHETDNAAEISLGFGDAVATIGDHIAHFYRTRDQKFEVLGPYIAHGIRSGDRCLLHCSQEDGEELCAWLASNGVDVNQAQSSGQFILVQGEATGDAQMALAAGIESETLNSGYKFVRSSGDWGWALSGGTSVNEMMRWEGLLDSAASDQAKIVALCQFDLAQFGVEALMDALKSHPLCIMGQILVPNPFHESSETFLKDLSERN
ncbi:MAG: MEDS domain-containing protein [Dehalococcoidia bacterium]